MRTKDRLNMAFRNLWRRKSRTILTILSVVIGTISIIIMLSLGLGMKAQETELIESFGDVETIEVLNNEDGGSGNAISESTVNKLKKIDGVKSVLPHKDFYSEIMVKNNDKIMVPTNYGIRVLPNDAFSNLINDDFEWGSTLTAGDKDSIILGSTIEPLELKRVPNENFDSYMPIENFDFKANQYFIRLGYKEEAENEPNLGNEDNTSKPTYVDVPFKIKGKLNTKSFLSGQYVFMNESSYRKIEKEDKKLEYSQLNDSYKGNGQSQNTGSSKYLYTQISVVCNDYDSVNKVEREIQELGFQTQSNKEMIDSINKSASTMMLVLGGIGSIAFIVSAIGIINTMLMSIYERQKEIGVMKVIGASVADIRNMFLLESGFIGFFGGLLGLLISLLISRVLNLVVANMGIMGDTGAAMFSIPVWLAVVGVAFSSMVGVLAGYIPAKRATRLSAIETLRSN